MLSDLGKKLSAERVEGLCILEACKGLAFRVLACDEAFEGLFGKDCNALRAAPNMAALFHSEVPIEFELHRCLQSGKPGQFHYTVGDKKVRMRAYPLGQNILTLHEDLAYEAALNHAYNEWKVTSQFLMDSPDVFWKWEIKTDAVTVTHNFFNWIGKEVFELSLSTFLKQFQDGVPLERALKALIETDTSCNTELKIESDRGIIHCLCQAQVVARNARGNASMVLGRLTDISAQKQLQEQYQALSETLENRVQRRTRQLANVNKNLEAEMFERMRAEEEIVCFKTTIDCSSEAVVWVSPEDNMRFVYANKAACEHFGCSVEKLLSLTLFDVNPQAVAAQALHKDAWIQEQVLTPGIRETLHQRVDNGNLIPVEVASTVFDFRKSKRVALTIHDLSKRKEAEASLITALEHERELSRLKGVFVNMVSHEFRTPLTSIQSATDLLEHYWERLQAPEREEQFDSVKLGIKRITQLMDDVLLIGRIEAGKLTFSPQLTDFSKLLQALKTTLSGAFPNRDIRLEGPSDGLYTLDSNLLQYILNNLLSNACKYSNGTVVLRWSVKEKTLYIEVEDSGIGIPEKDRSGLFKMFSRGSNVGNIKGVGVGLFCVRHCIDLHKGDIQCKSREGEGTLFTIRIPL
ncbi:MAG: hypothetical protein A2Y14_00700 [Verrucomicrobia bacterium GWF2_51_19]|nr:MAG: hypothetical protein A2Y14_00700 [Verrucomicrobia bacterium GWF2_51_19]HCJ12223.1 hypothetical protein [Opitutae bacterium]